MQRIYVREIYKMMPLLMSILATLLSIVVFVAKFKDFEIYQVSISVLASFIGATIVYMIIRIKTISSAPVVFISYTSKDKDFARKLAKELESIPVKVLIDEHELRVGDNIRERVKDLLDNSDYVAFVLSETSIKSEWTKKELSQAIEKKKKILPVLIDKSAVPEELEGIVYANFAESFDQGFQQIRKSFTR